MMAFAKLRAMLAAGEIGPGSNERRLNPEVLREIEQEEADEQEVMAAGWPQYIKMEQWPAIWVMRRGRVYERGGIPWYKKHAVVYSSEDADEMIRALSGDSFNARG